MIRNFRTSVVLVVCAIGIVTGTAWAQGLTGQLSGTVMDAGGGVFARCDRHGPQ